MEKKDKDKIERCYKNINDVIDEIISTQEVIDETKDDDLEEGSNDYAVLSDAADKLDGAITFLQNANKKLLELK